MTPHVPIHDPSRPEVAPATPSVNDTIRSSGEDTTSITLIRRAINEHITTQEHDLSDDPPPMPEVGTSIRQYSLLEKLGEGVSCSVFRAWDTARNVQVALKIVNWSNVFDRAAALKQMRIEAAALSRVKHPNVVRFIDLDFDPRWPYLVTEYIDGQSLGVLLRSGGSLPVEWVMSLISQMVDALGAVWKAGLVHRDIKSDNILIGPKGEAKLIDFGLAKSPALQGLKGQGTGEIAGTASYLAPEQAKDASVVDLRADIYSLGVALYESLTGQLPFAGKNRLQMIYHHLNTPPRSPAEVNPEVPPLVADLCLWMLVKNPNERPQNYEELRMAFDAVWSH
jgi:serine/threonine-protein kinase